MLSAPPSWLAQAGPPPEDLPSDWPRRSTSLGVRAAGFDWHVQVAGQGPVLVLLHGTGGSAHSWEALLPTLAEHATVVVPDLPGHGWTRPLAGQSAELSLGAIAHALRGLLQALTLPPPSALVGHSAGVALGLRWALDVQALGAAAPLVLGFAPSLVAPPTVYTRWMGPLLAPLVSSRPMAALLSALAAPSGMVDRLLDSTGSTLPPAQRTPYRQLFANRAHVRGAMGFMAAADLPGLMAECQRAHPRCAFVIGTRDAWVPERRLAPLIESHLPGAKVQRWRAGHLVHEEQPLLAAEWVLQQLPWAHGPAAAPAPADKAVSGADGGQVGGTVGGAPG
jgi:magnesium chelatase accessory protein